MVAPIPGGSCGHSDFLFLPGTQKEAQFCFYTSACWKVTEPTVPLAASLQNEGT